MYQSRPNWRLSHDTTTKWVTPKGLRDANINSNGSNIGDVLCTARTDLDDDWALCNGDILDLVKYPKIDSTSLKNIGVGLVPVDTANIVVNPVAELDNLGLTIVDAIYYNDTVVILYSGSKSAGTSDSYAYISYMYISYGPTSNPTEHFVKLKEQNFRTSDSQLTRLTPKGISFDGTHFIVHYSTYINSSIYIKYMYTSSASSLGIWLDSNASYSIGSPLYNNTLEYTIIGTFYNYTFVDLLHGYYSSRSRYLLVFNDIANDTTIMNPSLFNRQFYNGSLYGGEVVSMTSYDNTLYFLGYSFGGDSSNGYYQVLEVKQLIMPSNGNISQAYFANASSIWTDSSTSYKHFTGYKNIKVNENILYFYTTVQDTTSSNSYTETGISTIQMNNSNRYMFYPVYNMKSGGTNITPATSGCLIGNSSILFYGSNQSWVGFIDDIKTNTINAVLTRYSYNSMILTLPVNNQYVGLGSQTGNSAPYTQCIYTFELSDKTTILPAITTDKTYNYIKVK